MAIKFHIRLSLRLLLTLSLLLVPSQCYKRSEQEEEEESAEGALFDCFLKCGKSRQNHPQELTECEEICVKQYQERKTEETEGGGGGDEWSYPQIEEVRKAYELCLSECDKKQGSKQEDQCRKTCKHRPEELTKQQQQSAEVIKCSLVL